MARVKEFYFEAAELAFKCEMETADRTKALADWTEFRLQAVSNYGENVNALLADIYDSIADRAGQFWEDFSWGHTFEELQTIYTESAN